MEALPLELVDKILIYSKNVNFSIELNREYSTKKIIRENPNAVEFFLNPKNFETIKNWEFKRNGIVWRFIPEGGKKLVWASEFAARHGHVEIFQLLYENKFGKFNTRAMAEAAQNGHFAVVKWLINKRFK